MTRAACPLFLGICRTWSTCSIILLDSDVSSEAASMRWLLLDDAVRYRHLLQPGEQLAMYCPAVRCHLEQQQHLEAAQSPQLIVECADSVLLLVQADDGCSTPAVEAEQHSSPTTEQQQHQQHFSWYDSPASLTDGQQDVVLCGVVSQLQRLPSRPVCGVLLGCRLADSPADAVSPAGSSVQVHLQFLPQTSSKVGRLALVSIFKDGVGRC
jgi:hypothetical protein